MTKTALIFGSSGQVGSRLSESLESDGYLVLRVSRDPAGENWLPWGRVEELTLDKKIQVIVNAASPNSAVASADPSKFLDWMTSHSKRILRIATACRTAQIVSVSTTQVYSSSPKGTYDEESESSGDSPYALGHIALEERLLSFPCTSVLRLSNSFGAPGRLGKLDSSLVTNQLVTQAILEEKEPGVLNPDVVRDFLPVSELCRAVLWILSQGLPGLFNVSSSRVVSLGAWSEFVFGVLSEKHLDSHAKFPRFIERDGFFTYSNSKFQSSGFEFQNDYAGELRQLAQYLKKVEGKP